jgi:hypothetical protein
MTKIVNKSLLQVLLNLFGIVLAGCTLSAREPESTDQQNAVYTYAAQTIVAKQTLDAMDNLVAEESITIALTSQDTEIIKGEGETSTPNPSLNETQTPTIESSITPTLTETPIASPTPNIIWQDEFSNLDLWWTDDGDDYGFRYQDDGYLIYNNLLNAAIWSLGYLGLDDVGLEVDAIRLNGPEDSYYGVFCRHTNDGQNYYALVIADNGFFGILKMVDNEKEFIDSGIDASEIIHRGLGEKNRIRGICLGETMTLYTNGEKLLEVTDETHTNGGVGIIAGNQLSGIGAEILFDNFVVFEP